MGTFTLIDKTIVPSLHDSFLSSIEKPTNTEHDSFYIFTLHKCASMMLGRCFKSIGCYNGISNIDIDTWRFANDHEFSGNELLELPSLFQPYGYWYGVFRSFNIEHTNISPFTVDRKSILLVRDPRDILTSFYFSTYYSHVSPGKTGKRMSEILGTGPMIIDDFILSRAHAFQSTFKQYIDSLCSVSCVMVFRYEDIILDKLKLFVPAMKFLELDFPKPMLIDMIQKETILPSSENKYKHIRKVFPGDYKQKLSMATIEKLNEIFRDVLEFFGYEK